MKLVTRKNLITLLILGSAILSIIYSGSIKSPGFIIAITLIFLAGFIEMFTHPRILKTIYYVTIMIVFLLFIYIRFTH